MPEPAAEVAVQLRAARAGPLLSHLKMGDRRRIVALSALPCNLVIMEKAEVDKITGWFAGRLPDGWFTGAPSVTVDEKQVLVVGTLEAPDLGGEASAEVKAGAEAG